MKRVYYRVGGWRSYSRSLILTETKEEKDREDYIIERSANMQHAVYIYNNVASGVNGTAQTHIHTSSRDNEKIILVTIVLHYIRNN